jgi:hypothetical protein
VQAKLKEKLDIEREPYPIPGACSPPLANQDLNVEPGLGALLPGNVVYEQEGRTYVGAVEPEARCSPWSTTRSWDRSPSRSVMTLPRWSLSLPRADADWRGEPTWLTTENRW